MFSAIEQPMKPIEWTELSAKLDSVVLPAHAMDVVMAIVRTWRKFEGIVGVRCAKGFGRIIGREFLGTLLQQDVEL
jgi:hypothetical protein